MSELSVHTRTHTCTHTPAYQAQLRFCQSAARSSAPPPSPPLVIHSAPARGRAQPLQQRARACVYSPNRVFTGLKVCERVSHSCFALL